VTALHIERLALRVPGLSEQEGRRLAELVGGGLAAAPHFQESGQFGRMEVRVTAESGQDVSRLAEAIVAELLRQVERVD
jgi:hypothetical protein